MMFADRPVFIIGGGPSAGNHDLCRLSGRGATVAINNSAFKLPWAEFAFTADGAWLDRKFEEIRQLKAQVVAALPRGRDHPEIPGLQVIRRRAGVGFSRRPQVVYFSDNSAFAALNWVAASGARKIGLVGYDMTVKGWWHGGYEWQSPTGVNQYSQWAAAFNEIAPALEDMGCDVVNANPDSGVRCFRFADFDGLVSGKAWR